METLCQAVDYHSITLNPDVPTYYHRDYFGNAVVEFSVPFRHNYLEIISRSEVTNFKPSSEPLKSEVKVGEAAKWFKNFEYEFYDYLYESPFIKFTPAVWEFGKKILAPERKLSEAILDLNHLFTTDFQYRSGATQINTPVDTVLETRKGVCQDFAHTMISLLRARGLATRYVSGYIETYNPETSSGMVGSEQSHAWLDVYIPDFSWFGLDPTNDMCSSDRHIRVAQGRDFDDVSPVRGTFKGSGKQHLKVEVQMRRMQNSPPINKINKFQESN